MVKGREQASQQIFEKVVEKFGKCQVALLHAFTSGINST